MKLPSFHVEDLSSVEKKLVVRVEWSEVAAALDAAYHEAGQGLTLKGFRKGKLPRPLVERQVGARVEADVRRRLAERAVSQIADERGFELVTDPVLGVGRGPLTRGEPFQFEARIEIRVPIVPQGYFGLEIECEPLEPTEADVDAALDVWRQNNATRIPIVGRDRLRVGDRVVFGLEAKILREAGQPGSFSGEARADRVTTIVGPDADVVLPGVAAALVGLPIAAKGQELELPVPPNEFLHWRELVGRPLHLRLTVHEAEELQIPPIDDELVRRTGDAADVASLRERLRRELRNHREESRRTAVMRAVIEKNPVDVPPALVEARLAAMRARLGPPEGLKAHEDRHAQARFGLQSMFVLLAIADAEGITASPQEIDRALAVEAERQRKPLARLKAELAKNGLLDGVESHVIEGKTVDLLLSRATVRERPAVNATAAPATPATITPSESPPAA